MAHRSGFELWDRKEVAKLLALVEGDRDFYRELAGVLPAPIVTLSGGQAVTWANQAFLRLLDLRVEDLRGQTLEKILPIPGLTGWIQRAATGAEKPLAAQVRNLAVRITAIALRSGQDDAETMLLVERAREAAEVGHAAPSLPSIRAERMEALEAAAGRLAHDLNNPLMIVTGYSEELLQGLAAGHPLRAEAAEIRAAAGRIAAVTSRLTEFARKNANEAHPVDVSELVTRMEARIQQFAGERVTLTIEGAGGPVLALADAAQLEQAILTLASQDLESARERGRLTVRTETIGAQACITLRDDGRGLDASQQAAAFESGLTATADSIEANSGMALARAYSLVRQWGGDIVLASRISLGSEYRVYLPRPTGPTIAEPAPAPGSRTILVVDDEAGIRGLVRKILLREGYRVVEAASAEEALVAAQGQAVDLLLTDVMLPGITGAELARKMYTSNARLRVLYISGYTPDESVRSAAYPPGARFLAKPFTLPVLLDEVREALG